MVDQAKGKLLKILERHVPENAVHYCLDLWSAIPFHFKVTRKRSSKLGDYRFDRIDGSHTITVNYDLNAYSFLITYIHEFAHLLTTERNGKNAQAHGKEWKANFRELMEPVMTDLIFPSKVLLPLSRYMKNPKASTHADPDLLEVLRQYDDQDHELIPLSHLQEGDIFEFNQNTYRKLRLRRTRVLCQHTANSRKYLISKMALVKALKSNER